MAFKLNLDNFEPRRSGRSQHGPLKRHSRRLGYAVLAAASGLLALVFLDVLLANSKYSNMLITDAISGMDQVRHVIGGAAR